MSVCPVRFRSTTTALFVVALALAASLAIVVRDVRATVDTTGDQNDPAESLRLLCANKKVDIKSLNEIKKVIELFEENPPPGCQEEHGGAFMGMKQVLAKDAIADVCGLTMYKRILEFHTQFISVYNPLKDPAKLKSAKSITDGLLALPSGLRQFFILFVHQVSAICKQQLVLRLEETSDEQLIERDFELLEEAKQEISRVLGQKYRKEVKELKDVVILSPAVGLSSGGGGGEAANNNYAQVIEEDGDKQKHKLYVKVRFGDKLKLINDVCRLKFRPMYVELFFPVLRLMNLGYYDQRHTKEEEEKLSNRKEYTRWYGVIEWCELFEDLEVIQDTSTVAAARDLVLTRSTAVDQNKLKSIVVLSPEEAKEARSKIAERIERYDEVHIYKPRRVSLGHQRHAFPCRIWITKSKTREAQVSEFERHVGRLLKRAQSSWHQSIRPKLESKLHDFKVQFINRDQSSAAGRVAYFLDQHKVAIQVGCLFIGAIVLATRIGVFGR